MDAYTVPDGVRLLHPELAPALAALGIAQRSYMANGTLNHAFTDTERARRLFIVEGQTTKTPNEVVGDASLWLLVRELARTVCAAPTLQTSTTTPPLCKAADAA